MCVGKFDPLYLVALVITTCLMLVYIYRYRNGYGCCMGSRISHPSLPHTSKSPLFGPWPILQHNFTEVVVVAILFSQRKCSIAVSTSKYYYHITPAFETLTTYMQPRSIPRLQTSPYPPSQQKRDQRVKINRSIEHFFQTLVHLYLAISRAVVVCPPPHSPSMRLKCIDSVRKILGFKETREIYPTSFPFPL